MIGKMVLPVLGGTPAVWNTCLVYFQVMLLGGYLLAHGAIRSETARRSRVGAFVPVGARGASGSGYLLQPIAIVAAASSFSSMAHPRRSRLLWILAVSATLPLLLVSATAPLLQCWFALDASSSRE